MIKVKCIDESNWYGNEPLIQNKEYIVIEVFREVFREVCSVTISIGTPYYPLLSRFIPCDNYSKEILDIYSMGDLSPEI